MRTPRSLAPLIALAGLTLTTSSLAASQTFADDEFVDADWTVVELLDETPDGSAQFTGYRVLVGGNPGAHRTVTNTWEHDGNLSATAVAGHLRTQADYDPATDGEIVTIEFAFDARTTGTTYPLDVAIVFFPVLQQGNATYAAGTGLEGGADWSGLASGPWTADDFTLYVGDPGSPTHPDFSATGAPITFGVGAGSGPHALAGIYSTNGGIDNWRVTVSDSSDLPDAGADPDGGVDGGDGGSSGNGTPPPPIGVGAAPPRDDDGCSLRPGAGATSPPWWLLLAALGGLRAWRRRAGG